MGSSFSIYKYRASDTAASSALSENSYYGIRNDRLTTINGNNKTIKNVVINNTTEGTSGDRVNGALVRFVNTSLSQTYTYENMILSNRFIDGRYDMNSTYDRHCYAYSNPSYIPGEYVTYMNNAADYTDMANFSGWDTGIWEVKSGAQYPTLISNPEQ